MKRSAIASPEHSNDGPPGRYWLPLITVLALVLFGAALVFLIPAISVPGPGDFPSIVRHPIAVLQGVLGLGPGPRVRRVRIDTRSMGGGIEAYTVDSSPYPAASASPGSAPATPAPASPPPQPTTVNSSR
jgi:hypothetical protein